MPEWLFRHVPLWARGPVEWLVSPPVLATLALGSVLLFLLSIVGIPWFVARMPVDYFSHREREHLGLPEPNKPRWRTAAVVLKNLLGVVLLLLGLTMIFLPGQGMITIFVSLLFLDFPKKRSLQRRIIASGPVLRTLNALRRRAGREPLRIEPSA
jgi:hypothetical protein